MLRLLAACELAVSGLNSKGVTDGLIWVFTGGRRNDGGANQPLGKAPLQGARPQRPLVWKWARS